MLSIRTGRVDRLICSRPGITEIWVEVDGKIQRAVNYDLLTGTVAPGDMVQLNVTAVQLGLGTGGCHFVMANLSSTGLDDVGPGHLMKLRYTPLQLKVLSVEEAESPFRQRMENCDTLGGTPVVVGLLHSMLPLMAAGTKSVGEGRLRVVYVMTDGGALPIAFSRLVPTLKQEGLIDGTVTTGHAFGGDLEAVNIFSGLLAAKEVLKADVILVAMGPGISGTGTKWGFSGTEQGEAINAVGVLNGTPVAVPRLSAADLRPRHQGLSHHTLTILGKVTLVRATVVLPKMREPIRHKVLEQISLHGLVGRHRFIEVDGEPALQLLARHRIDVDTMGRPPQEDREFFLAAGAAGVVAGRLAFASLVQAGGKDCFNCGCWISNTPQEREQLPDLAIKNDGLAGDHGLHGVTSDLLERT